jgi:aminopeptidase N
MEDFLACFEEAGGVSLAQFARWYAQAGTPELSCALAYDPRTKTAELTVSQSTPPTPGQPDKVPLHIPLRLGLLGGNGQDLELRLASGETLADGVVQVTKARETFRFTGVSSRPVPSLLRSFSAPVRLSIERSDRDLAFLMANDSDLFGRWQAATDYAMRILIHHVRAKAEGRRSDRGEAFAKALGATVGNEELDPAYRAEMLRLPTESDIAREVARNIDPGHNLAARRQVMRLVATSLGDLLEDLYERHGGEKSFRPDARSAGKRALRNAALSLLAARNRPADRARVLAHYRAAGNMTDQAHALYLLAQRRGADRDGAIADFYSRWKSDNLVIDTWFAAQAAAPLASTVATVERLMQLPQFSLTAPNKVRALIGTFAGQNPSQFNRPDGAGYDLVARIVRELDAINPQVAARLLGAFRSWRSLEAGRRRLARKALARIAKAKGLSRDVYEIVTKTLE